METPLTCRRLTRFHFLLSVHLAFLLLFSFRFAFLPFSTVELEKERRLRANALCRRAAPAERSPMGSPGRGCGSGLGDSTAERPGSASYLPPPPIPPGLCGCCSVSSGGGRTAEKWLEKKLPYGRGKVRNKHTEKSFYPPDERAVHRKYGIFT